MQFPLKPLLTGEASLLRQEHLLVCNRTKICNHFRRNYNRQLRTFGAGQSFYEAFRTNDRSSYVLYPQVSWGPFFEIAIRRL